jgi:hypothetical protein
MFELLLQFLKHEGALALELLHVAGEDASRRGDSQKSKNGPSPEVSTAGGAEVAEAGGRMGRQEVEHQR